MKKHIKGIELFVKLSQEFPNAKCELTFHDDYTLLVAVVLSAQCTDKRVNQVTPKLFEKYPNFKNMADALIEDIEYIVKPCGFYRIKAKNIINSCKMIMQNFGGKLPREMKDLLSLPGVGRKTANVLLSNLFQVPAIAVDTHVFRVSNKLGIVTAKNVKVCEMMLQEFFDKSLWSTTHHLLVLHGRYICKARSPKCDKCNLKEECKEYKKCSGKNL